MAVLESRDSHHEVTAVVSKTAEGSKACGTSFKPVVFGNLDNAVALYGDLGGWHSMLGLSVKRTPCMDFSASKIQIPRIADGQGLVPGMRQDIRPRAKHCP